MSKEKQILQLLADGYSQRRTADTLWVSRNTVFSVITAAKRHCQSEYKTSISGLTSFSVNWKPHVCKEHMTV